jgi:hypothetical protein
VISGLSSTSGFVELMINFLLHENSACVNSTSLWHLVSVVSCSSLLLQSFDRLKWVILDTILIAHSHLSSGLFWLLLTLNCIFSRNNKKKNKNKKLQSMYYADVQQKIVERKLYITYCRHSPDLYEQKRCRCDEQALLLTRLTSSLNTGFNRPSQS